VRSKKTAFFKSVPNDRKKLAFHHPLLKERNDLIPYDGAAQNKKTVRQELIISF